MCHTGTGLSFPEVCSFLRMEVLRPLGSPGLGDVWPRPEDPGKSPSSCSWLGQDTSSALRDTGPSSTERTRSANFREHSVSLLF